MILAGVEHWVRIGFDFSQEKTTLRSGSFNTFYV